MPREKEKERLSHRRLVASPQWSSAWTRGWVVGSRQDY